MTRTTEAEPTLMAWIFEARACGMHIQFSTTAGGNIGCDEDPDPASDFHTY